ncbi:MAG: hypothetical protein IH840_03110 [Candidatus Heimdallarchaeota archaeon]|nr:hypothetical protein [Candidatus Heimdallarchaeota archaeon]
MSKEIELQLIYLDILDEVGIEYCPPTKDPLILRAVLILIFSYILVQSNIWWLQNNR